MTELFATNLDRSKYQTLEQWYLDRGLVYPPKTSATPPKHNSSMPTASAALSPRWLVLYAGTLNSEEASLLEKMVGAIGLRKSDFTAIDLAASESAKMLKDLQSDSAISHIKCGLVFGDPALKLLTSGAQIAMATMRGVWFTADLLPGVPLIPTWHPQDLIDNPSLKRATWADLLDAQNRHK